MPEVLIPEPNPAYVFLAEMQRRLRQYGMMPLLMQDAPSPLLIDLAQRMGWDPALSYGQLIDRLYGAPELDWLQHLHDQQIVPENWDPQYAQHVAAGLVRTSGLNGFCVKSPHGADYAIGIPLAQYQLLFSYTKTLVSCIEISGTAFRIAPAKFEQASATLMVLLSDFGELGFPFGGPNQSELTEAQFTLARSLAIVGSHFLYAHELSHILLKHHDYRKTDALDLFGAYQHLIHTQYQEHEADRGGLTFVLLQFRNDPAMTVSGVSLMLRLMNLSRGTDFRDITHPHPLSRIERVRFNAEHILADGGLAPSSVDAILQQERFWSELSLRLEMASESRTDSIQSSLLRALNEFAESKDVPPKPECIEAFLSRVCYWLGLGSPERVCKHLGEAKAQATARLAERGRGAERGAARRFFQNVEHLVDAVARHLNETEDGRRGVALIEEYSIASQN